MSAIIQNIKDSVMELRGVVNHHYKDKDEAYANQASIFKINYNIWNAVYKFIWTREISSYNDLLNTIKSDAEINSVNWKRMYTILLIVCVYSLLRSRILKNYEKTKVKQMVDTNKEEVWKKLNQNKERGVSEWDGDYSNAVSDDLNNQNEDEEAESTGFSFGKKSKSKYKKNVQLLQQKYEELQQQQMVENDDDDLDDILDLLED